LKKVAAETLIDELFREIDAWIAGGMLRPKRLKMAKPAALAMAEASLISFGADAEGPVGSSTPAGLGTRRV